MIQSMTGFGAASADLEGSHYVVEIRTLNNKYLKVSVRVPEELAGLEPELEAALSKRLSRGSVTLTVRFSDASERAASRINAAAIQRYLEQIFSVEGIDHDAAHVDLAALLSLPGVVINDTGEDRLEQARQALLPLVEQACDKVVAMRSREGKSLLDVLHGQREFISERLAHVADRAPIVVEEYQRRLRQRIDALLAESGSMVTEADLVREVAIYAERSDIAEEVSRLSAHLEQFGEIIDNAGGAPAGRTLDFLTQELLREANTIASKSSDAPISRHIVEIKGAIDRMREQVQNVE
jgi:uncharacterized protein (TIGR00255 family)